MITIGESNINDFYFDITSNLNYDITSLFGGNNLNIKDVKTTSNSTLILTNDCNVYGWGSNQYGELGLGITTYITELTHITSNITKIDCGQNHSLFLDLDGVVHSCGKNSFGQLGLSNNTVINTLSNINLDNIEDISAGDNLSLFKKTNGEIYWCGKLKYQVSEISDGGYNEEIENIPKFIASNVKKILADNDFIYYVTNNNDIYKNNDLILDNSTFTDININDHKMYILNDINRLNDVDTTNIVPIIPQSDIQPQPIAGTTEYNILTFTHSGGSETQTIHTLTFTEETKCDILILGGGGGGGYGGYGGGGGGGGGCLFYKSFNMNANETYTIKVGKGGTGGTYSPDSSITKGKSGSESEIIDTSGTIFKIEGAGGGGGPFDNGKNGGCGGGAGAGGTPAKSGGTVIKPIINGTQTTIEPNIEQTNFIYYGNIGGRDTVGFDDTRKRDGAGGGGIGEGGTNNQGYNGGKGGDGLYKATLNGVDYNFKDYFGINGIQEADGYYYIGGGGGGGDYSTGVPGNGGKGGGGDGGNGTNGSNATGYGSGGGGGGLGSGGKGSSGIVIIRYKTKMVNTTSYNGTYNKITKGFNNLFFKSLDNNIYTLNPITTTNTNYGTTTSELSFNKLDFFTDNIIDNIFSSKHKDNTLFITSNNLIYNSGDLIYNNLILQNTDNRPKLINDIFDTDLVNIIRYKNDDGYYLKYSDKVLDNDKNELSFSNIDSNNIKKIDKTNDSTVILTKEGTVYIYGNIYGNINSISYNGKIVIKESPVLPEEIIIDISCGYEQVLFRTANKKLYVLGDNSEGQLGTGDNIDADTPQNININSEEIEDIICGYNNSIVKTNSNYYISGKNYTNNFETDSSLSLSIKKIIARNNVLILYEDNTFEGTNEDGTDITKTDIEDVYINNSNIFFKKINGDIINENDEIIYSNNDLLTINKGIIDSNDKLLLSYKNNDFKIDTNSEYKKEWIYSSNSTYYMGNVAIGKTTATDKLDIEGTLSTNYGKQFKITHPLDSNLWLYHSSIECPRNDNIYRGEAIIKNGYVEVNIDKECNTTGGMIEGTFKKLNKNSQLFLQNNDTFDNVKGNIDNNIIKIYCENKNKDIKVNWIVIGERDDDEIKKLEITDKNGCLICEHLLS